ncbi:hypothetical protein LX36DRAFT_570180, partial [Colletotrichum falcatum]
MCGWEEKLGETQLCDRKIRPACYVYNDDGISEWAPGFGDGEARVSERDIPVLWFESKGKTRLGWLGVKWFLKPLVLDDPNRPADLDHPSNQARKRYADIRGYDSFEAMLASSGAEAAMPSKVPSSASASDSDSIPDVDMYDFGDNPPPVDDSDDEDYVERTSHKDKESGDEMMDAEATVQPLRRSTQEVRPTVRLGESGWPSSKPGAAAGTRPSSLKDMPTIANRQDVTMEDVRQATPSKSCVTGDEAPNMTGVNGGLPSVVLGTPATPINEDAAGARLSDSATPRTNDGVSESASPGPVRDPAGRVAISELARSNWPQRVNEQESEKADSPSGSRNHGEKKSRLDHTAMANLVQSAMKAASKSPSLRMEAPQMSPVLQVSDLLNDTPTPGKAIEQPLLSTQDKPAEARRPLPSGPVPDYRSSSGLAATQPTSRKQSLSHKPTLGPMTSQREGVSQQPS